MDDLEIDYSIVEIQHYIEALQDALKDQGRRIEKLERQVKDLRNAPVVDTNGEIYGDY